MSSYKKIATILSVGIFLGAIVFFVSGPATPADFFVGLRNLFGGSNSVCFDSNGNVVVTFGDSASCTGAGHFWGSSYLPQYMPPGGSNAPVKSVQGFINGLLAAIRVMQIIFWILTVGFGLYAAYLYLFAAGSSEKALVARRVLLYTVIAAAVSILAYSVPFVVDSFFNG